MTPDEVSFSLLRAARETDVAGRPKYGHAAIVPEDQMRRIIAGAISAWERDREQRDENPAGQQVRGQRLRGGRGRLFSFDPPIQDYPPPQT